MMKQKLVILSLLLVLSISFAQAFVPIAGQAGIDPGSLSANTGETKTITITAFPSVGGSALANNFNLVDFTIDYDESKLEYVGTTFLVPLNSWTGRAPAATDNPASGTVHIYAEVGLGQTAIRGPPNIGATATSLATMQFRVKPSVSGSAAVSITTAIIKKMTSTANGIADFAHPSTITIAAIQADPCAGISCQNGGTCASGACTCINGYTGNVCQTAPPLSCTVIAATACVGGVACPDNVPTVALGCGTGRHCDASNTCVADAAVCTAIAATACVSGVTCPGNVPTVALGCGTGRHCDASNTCVADAAVCTAVSATCDQPGVACPGNTNIAATGCLGSQMCTNHQCVANGGGNSHQVLCTSIDTEIESERVSQGGASGTNPRWTPALVSRLAQHFRNLFGAQ